MRTMSALEARVLAPWVERLGVVATGASALLLSVVLAGDLSVLVFGAVPSALELLGLHDGPVVALALAVIGNATTWYHWWRAPRR
jgi:hypothetical protein